MPTPIIDAVSVTAQDMARARDFYARLGFDFEADDAFISDDHLEPGRVDGAPRLMIDSVRLMVELSGETPKAPNHSVFGLLCESPSEVDALAAQVKASGDTVMVAPWDAPWGQRYATIVDPDGYRIDLFATL